MAIRNEDVLSGFFLLIVSVIIFITSFTFEALTTTLVGPAFMPQIISIIMAIFSIIITVSGFKKSKMAKAEPTHEESVNQEEELIVTEKRSYKPVLITLALMIGYLVLMPYIGFLIMTAVYMFVQMLILSHVTNRKIWLFILVSVITSATIYYLFRNVFYVMLPTGIIG